MWNIITSQVDTAFHTNTVLIYSRVQINMFYFIFKCRALTVYKGEYFPSFFMHVPFRTCRRNKKVPLHPTSSPPLPPPHPPTKLCPIIPSSTVPIPVIKVALRTAVRNSPKRSRLVSDTVVPPRMKNN